MKDNFRDMVKYYRWGYAFVGPLEPGSGSGGGQGGGSGEGMSKEEVEAAINNALNTISLSHRDGDNNTVVLTIGDRQSEVTLDDNYLTGVQNTNDGNVVFTMSDNNSSITVPLSDLDDKDIDCETF